MAETPRTIEKRVKSAMPLYITALSIIVFGLIFPLYKIWGILLVSCLGVATYFISKSIFKDKIITVDVAPEYKTGVPELDKALTEADAHIVTLRKLNDKIPDEKLTAAIDRMVSSGEGILSELSKNPTKARSMRRFLTYYLPTSVKLMEGYALQQDAGYKGENLTEIKNRIEANAETIARSFETSLDSLYAGEAIDISSDIAVLDSMVNTKTPFINSNKE
ncbi:MAG: 5-bromo-4-chloroindolyl phosphate hydrolysis family protein [Clostridia bacterium]|nr:5-bromo-4-chloroindolyl phosphate hydrolysis family protein [Clostridia bacterium]